MRRLVWITIAALALGAAGVAVAHDFGSKSVKSVSATFTAPTATDVTTSTCTGSDGTYATTRATYTGMAVSLDSTLNGAITVNAKSLINTSTGFGTVSGRIRIDTAGGGHTDAEFATTYTAGNVAGLASGHAQDAQLLANISGGFSVAGGFTTGKLGGGTAGGDAVELLRGGCEPVKAPKPDRAEARGAVTANAGNSITGAGVTCAVPSNLTAAVGSIKVGEQVKINCTSVNGTMTLDSVSGNEGHGHFKYKSRGHHH